MNNEINILKESNQKCSIDIMELFFCKVADQLSKIVKSIPAKHT